MVQSSPILEMRKKFPCMTQDMVVTDSIFVSSPGVACAVEEADAEAFLGEVQRASGPVEQ